MLLHPTDINTARLTWVPEERLFVTEASDLGPLTPSRVYDDACDYGYTLISARTGRPQVVVAFYVERDAEGDVLYTDYVPTDARGPVRHPDFRLRIFND